MKPKSCLHIEDQDTGLGDVSTRFLMYMSKSQGICKIDRRISYGQSCINIIYRNNKI